MSYKIPASLDRGSLDHEIRLTPGGFELPRVNMKVLVVWFFGIAIGFWVVFRSPYSDANGFILLLFLFWWLYGLWLLFRLNKTGEFRINEALAYVTYIPRKARFLYTRSTSKAHAFYSLVGIADISEDGLIKWVDGSVGRAYLVVGSASRMLFSSDVQAIIDQVDNFYQNISVGTEYITITKKEPQKVYHQLSSLQSKVDNLPFDHPDFRTLLEEQREILVENVGGSFESIHQYLFTKSDNLDLLSRSFEHLQAEVQVPIMFRHVIMLNKDEILGVLGIFYNGRSDIL